MIEQMRELRGGSTAGFLNHGIVIACLLYREHQFDDGSAEDPLTALRDTMSHTSTRARGERTRVTVRQDGLTRDNIWL